MKFILKNYNFHLFYFLLINLFKNLKCEDCVKKYGIDIPEFGKIWDEDDELGVEELLEKMNSMSIVTYKNSDIFYKLFNEVTFTNSEELFARGEFAINCDRNGDCLKIEENLVNGFKNYLDGNWFSNGFQAVKIGFGLVKVVSDIGTALNKFTNAFNTFLGYELGMSEAQRISLLQSYEVTGIVYAYADLRTANLKYPCLWNKMVSENYAHREKVMPLMKQGLAYLVVEGDPNKFIIAIGQDFGDNYSLMEWNPGMHVVAAYNDNPMLPVDESNSHIKRKMTLNDLDEWRTKRGASGGNIFHPHNNNCNTALGDLFRKFKGKESAVINKYMTGSNHGLAYGDSIKLMNALNCYLSNCHDDFHLEVLKENIMYI